MTSSENTTNLLRNLVKEKEEEIKRLKDTGAVSHHLGELQESKKGVNEGSTMAC